MQMHVCVNVQTYILEDNKISSEKVTNKTEYFWFKILY